MYVYMSIQIMDNSTFSANINPNRDLSQTSHRNNKGLSVREFVRIENIITQVKFF